MIDCIGVHVLGTLFSDLGLFIMGVDDGRKDTYGVFAEPVDPEEVCRIFFI